MPELRPGLAAVLADLSCVVASHHGRDGALSEVAPGTVGCAAGHRFDLARHGQLNLTGGAAVPANADTGPMVAARERFLSGGHFDALDAAVADLLGGHRSSPKLLVEIGAGTAHHLAAALAATGADRGLALDVSPAAARVAARRERIGSVVADGRRRWPVRTGAADAVLCLFAPRHATEFHRVLQTDGLLVVAVPEPDHLHELRSELGLLDIGTDKASELAAKFAGRFTAGPTRRVHQALDLSEAEVADLVAMGPNAHHAHLAPGAGDRTVTLSVTVTTWWPVRRSVDVTH